MQHMQREMGFFEALAIYVCLMAVVLGIAYVPVVKIVLGFVAAGLFFGSFVWITIEDRRR